MTFLRKSGSLVVVWIESLATTAWCSFCSGSRSCGMNFATTHFRLRACVKILDSVLFGIPRSASSSHTVSCWSLLIAAHTHSTFWGVLLVVGLPESESLSTYSLPSLKCLCHTFIWASLIALSPKAFWFIQIVSTKECLGLTQFFFFFPVFLKKCVLLIILSPLSPFFLPFIPLCPVPPFPVAFFFSSYPWVVHISSWTSHFLSSS